VRCEGSAQKGKAGMVGSSSACLEVRALQELVGLQSLIGGAEMAEPVLGNFIPHLVWFDCTLAENVRHLQCELVHNLIDHARAIKSRVGRKC
jgi:hypothetical protein